MRRISRAVANHTDTCFFDEVRKMAEMKRHQPTEFADFEFREMRRKEVELAKTSPQQRITNEVFRDNFLQRPTFLNYPFPRLSTQ
ncbi:MAG: hypothetical protein KTR18_11700 [Acidiferrobacterales bacterium]|nr:hypothetical protein [Acidiferrobacterales bacterium]